MTSSGFRIGTHWIPFNHRWDWETEHSLKKLLNVRNIIKAASRFLGPPKILAWQNQAPFKADSILFLSYATDEEEEEVSVSQRAAFQIRQLSGETPRRLLCFWDCYPGQLVGTGRPSTSRTAVFSGSAHSSNLTALRMKKIMHLKAFQEGMCVKPPCNLQHLYVLGITV